MTSDAYGGLIFVRKTHKKNQQKPMYFVKNQCIFEPYVRSYVTLSLKIKLITMKNMISAFQKYTVYKK